VPSVFQLKLPSISNGSDSARLCIGGTVIMNKKTTIILPKKMPLTERISVVSKEISEWLEALEKPLNIRTDILCLAEYKANGRFSYHYVIERGAEE